jgi:hypothetical protein
MNRLSGATVTVAVVSASVSLAESVQRPRRSLTPAQAGGLCLEFGHFTARVPHAVRLMEPRTGMMRTQAGGLPDGSRGSEHRADPRTPIKEESASRRDARRLQGWGRGKPPSGSRASGTPSGVPPLICLGIRRSPQCSDLRLPSAIPPGWITPPIRNVQTPGASVPACGSAAAISAADVEAMLKQRTASADARQARRSAARSQSGRLRHRGGQRP